MFSNKAQAAAVSVSAGLLGVGTYIATSPAPENIKVPLATVAYVSGMLGFAIKEALGEQLLLQLRKHSLFFSFLLFFLPFLEFQFDVSGAYSNI